MSWQPNKQSGGSSGGWGTFRPEGEANSSTSGSQSRGSGSWNTEKDPPPHQQGQGAGWQAGSGSWNVPTGEDASHGAASASSRWSKPNQPRPGPQFVGSGQGYASSGYPGDGLPPSHTGFGSASQAGSSSSTFTGPSYLRAPYPRLSTMKSSAPWRPAGAGGYSYDSSPGLPNEFNSFTVDLPAPNFSKLRLPEFNKDFYLEHHLVRSRSENEVAAFRSEHFINVEDENVPKPVTSWVEAGIPDYIGEYIQKSGFVKPTPIQAQAMPMAMSGRDLIAISETGSGKTLAYAIPALIHINAQEPTTPESGPICLVLAPTRELATQILEVFNALGASSGLRSVCVSGGVGREEQREYIAGGCDVLIATPGRLIEYISSEDVVLHRVTYFVLDEADRMVKDGFQEEIKAICNVIRRDRQCLMFTATWSMEVQGVADLFLQNAARVSVGALDGRPPSKIEQEVVICHGHIHKRQVLLKCLNKVAAKNEKVLIFVNSRLTCIELTDWLRRQGKEALSLQGEKNQQEREFALSEFRLGLHPILVATDLAQRGLDIENVALVINYEAPQMELGGIRTYTHRIGRTGRAGKTGKAITLLSGSRDFNIAADIRKVFEDTNQYISEDFLEFGLPAGREGFPDVSLPPADDTTASSWVPSTSTSTWGPPKSAEPPSPVDAARDGGVSLSVPAAPAETGSNTSEETARAPSPARPAGNGSSPPVSSAAFQAPTTDPETSSAPSSPESSTFASSPTTARTSFDEQHGQLDTSSAPAPKPWQHELDEMLARLHITGGGGVTAASSATGDLLKSSGGDKSVGRGDSASSSHAAHSSVKASGDGRSGGGADDA
ncbi:hypothetical protein JCM10207_009041 [Rhodosporidiobolus poonsookiae]